MDVIQSGLVRELDEEVRINGSITGRQFIGLLYLEDDNPVNHDHVGLIYIFDIDTDDVVILEEELKRVGFLSLEEIAAYGDKLTYWSQIIVNHLKEENKAVE